MDKTELDKLLRDVSRQGHDKLHDCLLAVANNVDILRNLRTLRGYLLGDQTLVLLLIKNGALLLNIVDSLSQSDEPIALACLEICCIISPIMKEKRLGKVFTEERLRYITKLLSSTNKHIAIKASEMLATLLRASSLNDKLINLMNKDNSIQTLLSLFEQRLNSILKPNPVKSVIPRERAQELEALKLEILPITNLCHSIIEISFAKKDASQLVHCAVPLNCGFICRAAPLMKGYPGEVEVLYIGLLERLIVASSLLCKDNARVKALFGDDSDVVLEQSICDMFNIWSEYCFANMYSSSTSFRSDFNSNLAVARRQGCRKLLCALLMFGCSVYHTVDGKVVFLSKLDAYCRKYLSAKVLKYYKWMTSCISTIKKKHYDEDAMVKALKKLDKVFSTVYTIPSRAADDVTDDSPKNRDYGCDEVSDGDSDSGCIQLRVVVKYIYVNLHGSLKTLLNSLNDLNENILYYSSIVAYKLLYNNVTAQVQFLQKDGLAVTNELLFDDNINIQSMGVCILTVLLSSYKHSSQILNSMSWKTIFAEPAKEEDSREYSNFKMKVLNNIIENGLISMLIPFIQKSSSILAAPSPNLRSADSIKQIQLTKYTLRLIINITTLSSTVKQYLRSSNLMVVIIDLLETCNKQLKGMVKYLDFHVHELQLCCFHCLATLVSKFEPNQMELASRKNVLLDSLENAIAQKSLRIHSDSDITNCIPIECNVRCPIISCIITLIECTEKSYAMQLQWRDNRLKCCLIELLTHEDTSNHTLLLLSHLIYCNTESQAFFVDDQVLYLLVLLMSDMFFSISKYSNTHIDFMKLRDGKLPGDRVPHNHEIVKPRSSGSIEMNTYFNKIQSFIYLLVTINNSMYKNTKIQNTFASKLFTQNGEDFVALPYSLVKMMTIPNSVLQFEILSCVKNMCTSNPAVSSIFVRDNIILTILSLIHEQNEVEAEGSIRSAVTSVTCTSVATDETFETGEDESIYEDDDDTDTESHANIEDSIEVRLQHEAFSALFQLGDVGVGELVRVVLYCAQCLSGSESPATSDHAVFEAAIPEHELYNTLNKSIILINGVLFMKNDYRVLRDENIITVICSLIVICFNESIPITGINFSIIVAIFTLLMNGVQTFHNSPAPCLTDKGESRESFLSYLVETRRLFDSLAKVTLALPWKGYKRSLKELKLAMWDLLIAILEVESSNRARLREFTPVIELIVGDNNSMSLRLKTLSTRILSMLNMQVELTGPQRRLSGGIMRPNQGV